MTVKGYKAFNSDWTCREKRYEVGKTYHEDNVALCKHGMHFCKELKDVFRYYSYNPDMKLAMVEASGKIMQSKEDSKCVTSDLKVVKELNVNSEEAQLAAVKQDGYVIHFIDKPSEAAQLEAVKQDGTAIHFIDKPNEEVQLKAVKKNGEAIQFIDNPSEEEQLEAAKQNGHMLY
mgnify:FL=1